jgi:pyrroline-5-carboxylate reductase
MADRSNEQDAATRWGFVGSGKMATALVRGMVRAGTASAGSIVASDPNAEARDALAREAGIQAVASNAQVAAASDVIVLAVKPQSMAEVLAELAPYVSERHLIVSIAAGITLSQLQQGLGTANRRLIRVMPNTPALIGQGASGYCLGKHALEGDEATVKVCLDAAGRSYRVPETLMDAVTGLSGSGPAYGFLMIEALSDGGVRAGLPRDVATALAAQTLLGAAAMVLATGLHPGVLKDQVTSPGGTTIAGVHALERGGLRAALMDAVAAAAARSAELGSK